jgi:hypothetical protein
MEKERHYTRYVKSGKNYQPIGETRDVLPAGFYYPVYDSYHDKAYFTQKDLIMPKLYVLPNDVQIEILDDIKRFWQSEDRYKQFGNVYKRNILLYSLPGNGKTSLITIMCNKLIEEHDGIVIFIDNVNALTAYHSCMERFRDVEPNRKVITIIEDFERLAKDDHYTAMLLQLLDGNTQFDNVVTIATTNYPQILEKRFTCRPSRFNLVIEYKKPNEEVRRAYITMKLKDAGMNVDDPKIKADIERYVFKTDGYTFDFVKEVIQGIYVDQIDETTLFERLNEIIKKNGKVVVSEEESKKIGFAYEKAKRIGGLLCSSNDQSTEPRPVDPEEGEGYGECDGIEKDEDTLDDEWASNSSTHNQVKVSGFGIPGKLPQEIREAFETPEEPSMDKLISHRNKIMKEWAEKDKEGDKGN